MGCSSLQVGRIKSLTAKLGVRPLNLSKRMDEFYPINGAMLGEPMGYMQGES